MIAYIVVTDYDCEGSSIEDGTQVYLDRIAADEAAAKLNAPYGKTGRVVEVKLPVTVELNRSGVFTLQGGEQVSNVHPLSVCEGRPCAVHNPSDHHMKDWPQHYRDPRAERLTGGLHPGLMERVCEHGVGHPDPDHMAWYASCHTADETRSEATHGCDGCCHR